MREVKKFKEQVEVGKVKGHRTRGNIFRTWELKYFSNGGGVQFWVSFYRRGQYPTSCVPFELGLSSKLT